MIEILEKKNVVRILLYLEERRGAFTYKSDVYEAISASPGMSEKMDELEEAGLIKQTPAPRNSTELSLTETGARVVELLCVADDLMWMRRNRSW